MHEVSFRPGDKTSFYILNLELARAWCEPSAFSKSLKSLHACGHSMFASINSVKAKQNRPTESFAHGSHRIAVDCSATITVTQTRPSAPVGLGKIWTIKARKAGPLYLKPGWTGPAVRRSDGKKHTAVGYRGDVKQLCASWVRIGKQSVGDVYQGFRL